MVSNLSFIHIRGIVSLSRQMRRYAKKMHKVVSHIATEEKKIKIYEDKGNAQKLTKEFEELLENEIKEENIHNTVEKDLMYIERSDEKFEHEEEEEIQHIHAALVKYDKAHSTDMASHMKEIDDISSKIHNGLEKFFHDNKLLNKDLYLHRSRDMTLKYKTMFSDEKLGDFMKKMFRLGRRDVKHEHRDEKHIETSMKELLSEVKHGDKSEKLEKGIKHLRDYLKELDHHLSQEEDHFYKGMLYATILHLHLLHKTEQVQPALLKKWHETGFPEDKYTEMELAQHKAEGEIYHQLQHIYRMARFVEHQN